MEGSVNNDVIYCNRCGAPMKKNQRYCMKCGNLNYDHPDNRSMRAYATGTVTEGGQQQPYVVGENNLNLAIGSTTAEQVKLELGCAMPLVTKKSLEVRGRDLSSGLPENRVITSDDVLEAMSPSIEKIVDLVKATLEKTPPELASDIVERGITLTGGGALIKNIDMLISQKTEIPVYIADRPLDCVANGTGKTIEDMDKLRTALINARKSKQQ